jgi:hypothetical protein
MVNMAIGSRYHAFYLWLYQAGSETIGSKPFALIPLNELKLFEKFKIGVTTIVQ